MAVSNDFGKIWVIEAGDDCVRGGICVSKKGFVITSSFDMTPMNMTNLRGRFFGSHKWFDFKILMQKPNFGLLLLAVKQKQHKSFGFEYFNLNKNNGVDLLRGDLLHGVLHSSGLPFTSVFGRSCRPFLADSVVLPPMDSLSTLKQSGDFTDVVWDSPIELLCTKHVIEIDDDDDDEDTDVEEVGVCVDGGSRSGSSDSDSDSMFDNFNDDDCSFDSINDDHSDNSDSDSNDDEIDIEDPLQFLHPDIPIIQVHGFNSEVGSRGSPIFKDNIVIGIYYFTRGGFHYIMPVSFLDSFLSHSVSLLKKIVATKKEEITNVSRPSKRQKMDPTTSDTSTSLSRPHLDKTWVIECGDTVRGGICVSKKGMILTSWFDITTHKLLGRHQGGEIWFELKVLEEAPNFDLVLLSACEPGQQRSKLRFPFFDLKEQVDLLRGDPVYTLFHCQKRPFGSSFGHLCRPFIVSMAEFPLMSSKGTLSHSGDSRQEVWNYPITSLYTKHVITIDRLNEDSEEFDDDLVDKDDSDNESDEEYHLDLLHPDIPVIQIHGFGRGTGCRGSPVFNYDDFLIGIYCFASGGFQYVIPLSVLDAFLTETKVKMRAKRRIKRRS